MSAATPEAPRPPDEARLARDLSRLEKVAEAAYALHTTLDLDVLLGLLLNAARDGVDADRGTVFLMSDDRTELWSRVVSGDQALVIRQPVGKGISGSVAATGGTIRIREAHDDPRFDRSWDLKTGYRTRQILCTPIRARDGRIAGVFQLLNKKKGDFDAEDEEFLSALSAHAALAVENARLHRAALEKERQDREIALVQAVQRGFQPERMDEARGAVRIAGLNELCEDASGDYYDVIELSDGRFAIALGDVSGHGLGAAIVMTQARSLLRAFLHSDADLARVLNLLNDFLARDLTGGKFISLFVGLVDPRTGRMEWCNAGHLPPLLLRAEGGAVERLDSNGRILGILPDAALVCPPPVDLGAGDLLLLYTDGVTEAADPAEEQFGEDRLVTTLERLRAETLPGVLAGIRATLLDWTKQDRMRDDLTLLAIRREA